ncbi:hypothetical protein ACSTDE_05520 [Enterobacter hormaechei]|uniref:hypothetical protein n=1 Tax=Enterobacter hormaechei TaxID=158836 RepID=UPI001377B885|nr:hypothetical protein [Enterobacter hormaechei]MDV5713840.1 hypothetical protein [Enterobacter hormaechei]NBF28306.1 hypothetical protein [Enterobacter hormaechei]
MSVNRYEFEDYGTNEPDGRYVTYEDYSALEARCAALAAENAGLKESRKNLAEFIHDELNADYPLNMDVETPATDSFLAEVRAQGVDALVERRLTAARLAKEAGHEITARDLEGEAIRARFFAMEIRKGVQS